jgi:hypothetical protein
MFQGQENHSAVYSCLEHCVLRSLFLKLHFLQIIKAPFDTLGKKKYVY